MVFSKFSQKVKNKRKKSICENSIYKLHLKNKKTLIIIKRLIDYDLTNSLLCVGDDKETSCKPLPLASDSGNSHS